MMPGMKDGRAAATGKKGRREALLIIGPTGSGKTPLGRLLEAEGFRGRKCRHFDFGERLRAAAGPVNGLNEGDLAVIRRSLAAGTILEREDLGTAGRVLASFIDEGPDGAGDDLIVLNGFPRDVEQAEYLGTEVPLEVRTVVCLEAPDEVILERMRLDPAGDRRGRTDGDREAVLGRLAAYRRRTRPLLGHYRSAGAEVIEIAVLPDMLPPDMLALIGVRS